MRLLRAKLQSERAEMLETRGGPASSSAVVVIDGDLPLPPGTFADAAAAVAETLGAFAVAAAAATAVPPATAPVDGGGGANASEEEPSAYSSSAESSEEEEVGEADFGEPSDSEL